MTFPPPPPYVEGHNLLTGKGVLVTAAAGTGIGFAVAKRCQEEGARLVIADKHERRLAESAAELGVLGVPCDVTQEADVQNLFATAAAELGGDRHPDQQRGARWHCALARDDRRPVVDRARRHAQRNISLHSRRVESHVRAWARCDREQRFRDRLAWPGRPGALRRGQGRCDGAHTVRGDRGWAPRCAGQLCGAEPGDARQPGQGHHRGAARSSSRGRRRTDVGPSRGRSPT